MGQVIDERPDTPRRVAARRLDFDHVGAHVGQQAGAQMPFEVGEIENAQASQRAALAHLSTSAVVWRVRSKKVTFLDDMAKKSAGGSRKRAAMIRQGE